MNRLRLIILAILFPFLLAADSGPVLLIVGTRPEAIKVIPVYEALKKEKINVQICFTGQHKELVEEIFSLLNITPNYNFNIMKPAQDLAYVTTATIQKTSELIANVKPSLLLVQGDTTSAMASALAAFYHQIPIGHIEAGLRTRNMYGPFPEEMNRQIIGRIATLHFTPTALATQNLIQEGILPDNIHQTGNTVVDALYLVRDKIEKQEILPSAKISLLITKLSEEKQKIFLLTMHRRESIQSGMEDAMMCIYSFLKKHPEVSVIYPVHPNPKIKLLIEKTKLETLSNLILLQPLPYNDLVYLMMNCKGVLTDSGGIQEEAVSLKRPTLVLRNETDRPEGLVGGLARLVGTDSTLIQTNFEDILTMQPINEESSSPYGDGKASQRIAQILKNFLNQNQEP